MILESLMIWFKDDYHHFYILKFLSNIYDQIILAKVQTWIFCVFLGEIPFICKYLRYTTSMVVRKVGGHTKTLEAKHSAVPWTRRWGRRGLSAWKAPTWEAATSAFFRLRWRPPCSRRWPCTPVKAVKAASQRSNGGDCGGPARGIRLAMQWVNQKGPFPWLFYPCGWSSVCMLSLGFLQEREKVERTGG